MFRPWLSQKNAIQTGVFAAVKLSTGCAQPCTEGSWSLTQPQTNLVIPVWVSPSRHANCLFSDANSHRLSYCLGRACWNCIVMQPCMHDRFVLKRDVFHPLQRQATTHVPASQLWCINRRPRDKFVPKPLLTSEFTVFVSGYPESMADSMLLKQVGAYYGL